MEHRCSRRQEVELTVVLYRRGAPVAIGTARDLGRGGLRVEPTHAADVPGPGVLLEVALTESRGRRLRAHRLPVEVVHCGGHGVGLMFVAVDAALQEIVDALMADGERGRDNAAAARHAAGGRS